jgi:hypothetical protein
MILDYGLEAFSRPLNRAAPRRARSASRSDAVRPSAIELPDTPRWSEARPR